MPCLELRSDEASTPATPEFKSGIGVRQLHKLARKNQQYKNTILRQFPSHKPHNGDRAARKEEGET